MPEKIIFGDLEGEFETSGFIELHRIDRTHLCVRRVARHRCWAGSIKYQWCTFYVCSRDGQSWMSRSISFTGAAIGRQKLEARGHRILAGDGRAAIVVTAANAPFRHSPCA